MESVISLSGTVLTINADANVSWSCKVDGNIFLSKYQGIGSDKINIYYSSTSPFAVIYFLPHNECLAMSQIIEFPLNGEDLNGFYVSPSSMSMKSGNEYIAEANSQYGISLSADTDSIVLSKTSLDKGYNTFIVSGINTNIDGYVIATEKNTNIKAYIHITQSIYENYDFIYIFNQFGNDVSNKNIQWTNEETYFTVKTNSYISNVSTSTNFIIQQLDNTTFQVTPKDNKIGCQETITITNANGNSVMVTLAFKLQLSTKMIHLTKSSEDYYYDYYSMQSQNHYFNRNYEDIGETFTGDTKTQYEDDN